MQRPHHEIISDLDQHLQRGQNPADRFHSLNLFDQFSGDRLPAILHQLLVQSKAYKYLSFNLADPAPQWQQMLELTLSTDQFDTVVSCNCSEQVLMIINPRRPEHWRKIAPLTPGSLVVVYTRALPDRDPAAEKGFLEKFKAICQVPTSLSPDNVQKEAPPPCLRESPRYAVPVTNEFFHYGNVEAWQNIIDHYHDSHPGAKVHIFHRQKPVHQISTLFKWGKVSVGDVIHFSISGPRFRNVARLKKYLTMGASPRYMPFIKKHLTDTLKLF